MKINEIIVEAIDQKEADEVLKSLVASGDPAAKFFQQTRYNPIHSSIDSAQRAAERLAQAEQKRKTSTNSSDKVGKTASRDIKQEPKNEPKKQSREPGDWGDRFYGNRYTGSLDRGASLGDVDLDIDFDQRGLKTIGKTIGAVKSATRPISKLATAFKAGMNAAPSKR